MKKVFPEGTISVTYRREKCLKELISLSESASRVSNLMRVDVTYVRIIWFLKMNPLVLLQVRHIR